MRARLVTLLIASAVLGGCTTVLGTEFDSAVAKPTACDPLAPQTSDPRTSKRCAEDHTCVVERGEAFCAPSRKTLGVGGACRASDDCAPGKMCTTVGCMAMCVVGSSCADGSPCVELANEVAARGNTYGFCLPPSCSPMTGDGADPALAPCSGATCRFAAPGRTGCFASTKPQRAMGSACTDDFDCLASDSCHAGKCSRLCRLGASDCPDGRRCAAGASDLSEAVVNGREYGHCE